jgi:hypothetical protein
MPSDDGPPPPTWTAAQAARPPARAADIRATVIAADAPEVHCRPPEALVSTHGRFKIDWAG